MTSTNPDCTCHSYHAAEKKDKKKKDEDSIPFWLTFSGLMMRIDGLAQDFLFGVTNDAFQAVASANQVEYLHYLIAGDDRVCEQCLDHSRGGERGFYRADSPQLPRIPVHPHCRCQWELVIADLNQPALPI